jgi:hypothetical protein
MVASLFTVHSPAAGECKSDVIVPFLWSDATSSVVRNERYVWGSRTLAPSPTTPVPPSRHRPLVAPAVAVAAAETSASARVGEPGAPRRRGAPPCRAPVGIQCSVALARPCAVDDLRRAVGRRHHGRRSPAPPPSEIPSSPQSRPVRVRAPCRSRVRTRLGSCARNSPGSLAGFHCSAAREGRDSRIWRGGGRTWPRRRAPPREGEEPSRGVRAGGSSTAAAPTRATFRSSFRRREGGRAGAAALGRLGGGAEDGEGRETEEGGREELKKERLNMGPTGGWLVWSLKYRG